MTLFLHDFGPALRAELLKTKRTLALVLAFVAPALIALLNFVIYLQRSATIGWGDREPWISLTQNNLVFWTLLMAPLFTSLQTALVAGLEHTNKNWKHIFSLPISRGAIYAAKHTVAMGLIGLSSLVLWGAIIISGLLLRQVRPDLGLPPVPPSWAILKFIALAYVTSWLIVALHTWVGVRWPSFVVAMSVGVAVTVVAIVVVQSDYLLYYPWTWPSAVATEAIGKGRLLYGWLAMGALGGILGVIIGGLEFTHRDVL